jgi:hypothetical protein
LIRREIICHEIRRNQKVPAYRRDNDEDQALAAGLALREAGFLRLQVSGSNKCQEVVVLDYRPMNSARVYVVKAKILEWRPQADNALRQLRKQRLQPPVLPDNFASLPPEAKQNFLLSNAMQLAAVAQGRTSVELEQLPVDRNAFNEKRQEKVRCLISKIPELEHDAPSR